VALSKSGFSAPCSPVRASSISVPADPPCPRSVGRREFSTPRSTARPARSRPRRPGRTTTSSSPTQASGRVRSRVRSISWSAGRCSSTYGRSLTRWRRCGATSSRAGSLSHSSRAHSEHPRSRTGHSAPTRGVDQPASTRPRAREHVPGVLRPVLVLGARAAARGLAESRGRASLPWRLVRLVQPDALACLRRLRALGNGGQAPQPGDALSRRRDPMTRMSARADIHSGPSRLSCVR
jgi:hypothetical protein